ncbi:MAG: type IV pilus secretin PilQ [Proteobacteria bacterium]|nr:type IV pilus secretin PilQ [Pseudomonadota bacterium]
MSFKIKRITLMVCIIFFICIPYNKVFGVEIEKLRLKISSVEVSESEDALKFLIKSNKSLNFTSYVQENPWKLVVEFPVVDITKFSGDYEVNKGIIQRYAIQQKGKNDNYTGILEVNFSSKPQYNLEKIDNGVLVTISKNVVTKSQERSDNTSSRISINNVLYSGERNKFILILETTGKPVFLNYTLNNPLRVVFDITNATYDLPNNEFIVKNSFINSIRFERFPGMTRVFVDVLSPKLPVFIPKAENNKLIVEFAVDDEKEALKRITNIDAVDFSVRDGIAQIRVKKAGYQDFRALKLKDNILVFDINNVNVNKGIQKTYDTASASDIIKSFTLYQLKPIEENKARFVIDLKGSFPYRSYKDGDDLVFEFYKESPVSTQAKKEETTKTREIKAQTAPAETKVADVVKPQEQTKPLEQVKKIEPTKPAIQSSESKEPPTEIKVTIKPKQETVDATGQQQQYKGIPITITLKDADIQHILKLLADAAREDGQILNIVASDDVKGKLSIQLERVPWDQVLDLVLEVNNLGMKRIGNIIRIMPKERLKREQEELLTASKVKEKLGTLELEIVPINYGEAQELVDKIKPLLSSRGTVTVDKRNNSLILNDLREYITEAKKLITKLDTPPQQVVIEARVVEATSDFSREIGIQWGVRYAQTYNNAYRWGISGPGTRADTTTNTIDILTGIGGTAVMNTTVAPVPYFLNLPAAIGQGAGGGINFALVNLKSGHALDIQLSALENRGMGKILSRPKITTLNNVEANIQQGSSIPYETLSDKGTQTQFIDANLQLTVTPRITPDNSIILKVKVSNNNPNTSLRSARGVPSIDKNEATTEILVRDGQTIVIGGIIRNKETVSKNGIPFLMDIPVIGWLFRKEIKTVENRELLIFLTPNIVKKITETEAS